MEHAYVDGIQLEYEVTGAGEPVLLIHGAFVADSFRPFLAEPKLAGDYQLITYRRRGYGGSGGTIDRRPVSAERQAADCGGLLRWLGLQRAHIVGHSFGGCVALQLALDAPQLVRTWLCWSQPCSSEQAPSPIASPCCAVQSDTGSRGRVS